MTRKGELCRWLLVGLTLFSLILSFYVSMPVVRGAETHDIAVTSVVRNWPAIPPGVSVKINVTVENQGTTAESFNLTVYATNIVTNESITIQSTSVDLSAGANETLTFVWKNEYGLWRALIFLPPLWDTDPMVEDFTIWADASVVEGEVDTSDNIYVDGNVRFILRFGDVDGNGVFNIFDIVRIAYRYGAELGDPRYDPLMDRSQDGVINIFDVVRVAGAYGTSYF